MDPPRAQAALPARPPQATAPAIRTEPPVAPARVREPSAPAATPLGERFPEAARKNDEQSLPSTAVDPPLVPATTATADRVPVPPELQLEGVARRLQRKGEPSRTTARDSQRAPTIRAHEHPVTRRPSLPPDQQREHEPPIVHVTIGRVEVRAAPDQKPDDAGDVRKQPAVRTLDAYLKQRAEARR
jgi:hypothetical protein